MNLATHQNLALETCDQEPIHSPGFVQPHGVLMGIDPGGLAIVRIGGDARRILGREPAEILDAAVEEILPGKVADFIRSLRSDFLSGPTYVGSIRGALGSGDLDITAHEGDGLLMLEIEPASLQRASAAEMLAKVRAISTELEPAFNVTRLCEVAVQCVRRLTGFDRVMVYRFLEDGAGCVIAEAKTEELPAFLNHHYPASDIPKQARALYLRNLIRIIPDVDYIPAPVIASALHPAARSLDMSDCALRSVSPIHIQYLKNMGVSASMSVSIVQNGALWGLIACHHMDARLVSYELRETCKHVGQILTQHNRAHEEAERHAEFLRLNESREDVIRTLTEAGDPDAALDQCSRVQGVVPSTGVAIRIGEQIAKTENSPSQDDIRELSDWLLQPAAPMPYATNVLSDCYPPAAAYSAAASGLLATVVSGEEPIVILWFRSELIETIKWAGDPHKPAEPGAAVGTLTPRKSFDVWRETVRGRSNSWSITEVNAARSFQRAVFDLRQHQRIRELNIQLQRTLSDKEDLLAQKGLLMQEVNHRVQNSLQIVNAMLDMQAREATDPNVKAHFDEAMRRIMAVSMVHQRLWRSDQIQNVEFGSFLNELCEGLVKTWGPAWVPHLTIEAKPVLLPTNHAVALAIVITELLTNAVKYAYDGEAGPVRVTVGEQGRNAILVTVADRGTGIQGDGRKSGLGTRLTKALVTQLGGEIKMADAGPGTCVTLSIPYSAHIG